VIVEATCSTCGKSHNIDETSLGADAPAQWRILSEAERLDSELTGEQCVIKADGKTSFYIRACLDVPVKGESVSFTWGVWVSLSEDNFLEMSEHWHDPSRIGLGPYFGWLCTAIPEYRDTMYLKTNVYQREVGVRPRVELQPTDHPLAVHQREGIDRKELQAMVERILHEA
jgi:hypothetical protein